MNRERSELHRELRTMKVEIGLFDKVSCTKEENTRYLEMIRKGQVLPKGVYRYQSLTGPSDEFYTIDDAEISEEELREYVMLKQCRTLISIRKCVTLLAVLAVLGFALGVLLIFLQK